MVDSSSNTPDAFVSTREKRVEEFVRLLSGCERQLYDFVFALVGNLADADEVIQETKLRLWEQFDKFEPGTNFGAWARTIGYYQVLDFRKRSGRLELHLSSESLEAVADEVAEQADDLEARQRALEICLQKLSVKDRDLVMRCYDGTTPINNVADSVGRTVAATYQWLWRIRTKLFRCIQHRLLPEEA